jgi:poly(A) polymerase
MCNLFYLSSVLVLFACGTPIDAESGEKQVFTTPNKDASVSDDTLVLLTYNVMGSSYSPSNRIPVLLDLLTKSDADVIALQEVDAGIYNALSSDSILSSLYTFSLTPAEHSGGLLFLTKLDITNSSSYILPDTRLDRSVHFIEVMIHNEIIRFATVHLDSYLEDGERRAKQLDFIQNKLVEDLNAVILGDFNFGDSEEPETSHLDTNYRDAWKVAHPDLAGYTWNIEENYMAQRGSFPTEGSRRLDRTLVRSRTWEPIESIMVGIKTLEGSGGKMYVSDHYGLKSILVYRPK